MSLNVYMNNNALYVLDEDEQLVYRTESYTPCGGELRIMWNLVLVAGKDYINPDVSDEQGWCPANRFTDGIQFRSCSQYLNSETLEELLKDEGFKILGKYNDLHGSLRDIVNRYVILGME